MKTTKKRILLRIMHELGFFRLVTSSQRNKVTILMLHGVTNPAVNTAWIPLRPQLNSHQLTRALTILSKYYKFISFSNAVEMLAGTRPLQPNSIALTFDDGYQNNLTVALPILRQFNATPTIFLSTKNITEQKPLWFDRLDYAMQTVEDNVEARNKIPELSEIDFSSRKTLSLSFITFIRKEKHKFNSDKAMRSAMKNLAERLEQLSGRRLTDIFNNDPWSKILTWEEVKIASQEVCFGSHGVDHPVLNLASPVTIQRELIKSRETIEFHTKKPCNHLAYPNGAFNKGVISIAKAQGYTSAVTTIPGQNKRGDELLTLHRIAFPRTESASRIIAAVSGCSVVWQKAKKYIHYTTRQDDINGCNKPKED